MLLNDREVSSLSSNSPDREALGILPLIENFLPSQIRDMESPPVSPHAFGGCIEEDGRSFKAMSYGLSSAGYDMRLSSKDIRIFGHLGIGAIDPKNFDQEALYTPKINIRPSGEKYILVPPRTYGLGVSIEKFNLPPSILSICVGKSTYARCGLFINTTPMEPGWSGHLTIEFFNANNAPFVVYVEEGICQCLFLSTKEVSVSYSDRKGKYQDQGEEVVLPR